MEMNTEYWGIQYSGKVAGNIDLWLQHDAA